MNLVHKKNKMVILSSEKHKQLLFPSFPQAQAVKLKNTVLKSFRTICTEHTIQSSAHTNNFKYFNREDQFVGPIILHYINENSFT